MATPPSAPPLAPLQQRFKGCSSISTYHVLSKLGEGTFGEVHKARSNRTGNVVALKKILMHNEKDGFPVTAIREIKLLKSLSHVNILRLEEMAVKHPTSKDRKQKAIMYMVTPYMEHDLSGLLTNQDVRFTEPQIKCYMLQLLEGLRYLHTSHILHRDMKAANLLISNRGILQIADFGLARHYEEPPPQKGRGGIEGRRTYTGLVVTRWYRPPELLLGLRQYTPAIDLWGVGCVLGEMFKRTPILQGQTDMAQLDMIFDLIGAPTDESMPGWNTLPQAQTEAGPIRSFDSSFSLSQKCREWGIPTPAISLLTDLLKLDWRRRITAVDALDHPYFTTAPLPAKPSDIPSYDDSHELDHRLSRGQKAPPPPAPVGGSVGMGQNHGPDWMGTGAAAMGYFSGTSRPPSRNEASRDSSQHARDPKRLPASAATHGSSAPANMPQRPGWAREGHDLPPRPPKGADTTNNGNSGNARGGAAANRPSKDTYVPSYAGERDAEGGTRGDREDKEKDKDRRPPPRDRDRDRDWHRDRPRERDLDRTRDRPRFGDRNRGERVEIDRYTPGQANDRRDRDRDRDRDRARDREREQERDRQHGLEYGDAHNRPSERDRGRDRTRETAAATSADNRSQKRTRSPSDDDHSRERKVRTSSRDRERDKERDKDKDWDKYNNREREGLEIFGRR